MCVSPKTPLLSTRITENAFVCGAPPRLLRFNHVLQAGQVSSGSKVSLLLTSASRMSVWSESVRLGQKPGPIAEHCKWYSGKAKACIMFCR